MFCIKLKWSYLWILNSIIKPRIIIYSHLILIYPKIKTSKYR